MAYVNVFAFKLTLETVNILVKSYWEVYSVYACLDIWE
jgi:hypothetical protein